MKSFSTWKRHLFICQKLIPKTALFHFSENTNSYLILLKNNNDIVFNIPNVSDIDYETKLIIMVSEKGDAISISKVGYFFCKGLNNLHQDECWAYACYCEASKLGYTSSSFLAVQFNEKGYGKEVNLSKAFFITKKQSNSHLKQIQIE